VYKPFTIDGVRQLWIAQNPRHVAALTADGLLSLRLEEAHEYACLVLGDAIERGLDLDSALELAKDAIGLPTDSDHGRS
jgi:hypothetical protein